MLIRSLLLLAFLQNLILCSDLNVGSIFTQRYLEKPCYYDKELITLTARRAFQEILPPSTTPDAVDTNYIQEFLQFVEAAVEKIHSSSNSNIKEALVDALADTLGGYLRTELLPNARYAYYVGTTTYDDVRSVNDLYEDIRIYLNTMGYGWRTPKEFHRRHAFVVDKINIDPRRTESCSELITERDQSECIKIPMPILDEVGAPSSIAFPFKNDTLMSLFSKRSSQALVRYYRTAAECILLMSTVSCRSEAFTSFNRDLCWFIKNDVAPHLADERWYVGFGGVLQVTAAVRDFCDLNQLTTFAMERRDIEPATSRHKNEVYRQYNHFMLVQTVIALAVTIWVFISLVTGFVNRRKGQNVNFNMPFKKFKKKDQMTAYSSQHSSRRRSSVKKASRTVVPLKIESVYDMNEQVMKQIPVPDCSETVHIQDVPPQVDVKKSSASVNRSSSGVSQKSILPLSSSSPPRIDAAMAEHTANYNNRRAPCTSAKAEYSTSRSSCTSSSGTSRRTDESLEPRRSSVRSAASRIVKDFEWAKRKLRCKRNKQITPDYSA